jgi:hypothetical protein
LKGQYEGRYERDKSMKTVKWPEVELGAFPGGPAAREDLPKTGQRLSPYCRPLITRITTSASLSDPSPPPAESQVRGGREGVEAHSTVQLACWESAFQGRQEPGGDPLSPRRPQCRRGLTARRARWFVDCVYRSNLHVPVPPKQPGRFANSLTIGHQISHHTDAEPSPLTGTQPQASGLRLSLPSAQSHGQFPAPWKQHHPCRPSPTQHDRIIC